MSRRFGSCFTSGRNDQHDQTAPRRAICLPIVQAGASVHEPCDSVVLALGISSTTAIFSVVYGTFFAPLPYRDADALVMVWSQFRGSACRCRPKTSSSGSARRPRSTTSTRGAAGASTWPQRTGRKMSRRASPRRGSWTLGYGHPLALGRSFTEEEGTVGRDRVVILTYRVWRDRFGGDPGIVGRQVRLDNDPYTVVGVLGEGPADHQQSKLWLPLAFTPEQLTKPTTAR